MATIPQKELRNNVSDVLRRAERGERITITVAGRPVAELGPASRRRWVQPHELAEVFASPPDPTLDRDLRAMTGEMRSPWED
jgi:prevent-host-death family protein